MSAHILLIGVGVVSEVLNIPRGLSLIYLDSDRLHVGLDMQTIPSTGSDDDSDGSHSRPMKFLEVLVDE